VGGELWWFIMLLVGLAGLHALANETLQERAPYLPPIAFYGASLVLVLVLGLRISSRSVREREELESRIRTQTIEALEYIAKKNAELNYGFSLVPDTRRQVLDAMKSDLLQLGDDAIDGDEGAVIKFHAIAELYLKQYQKTFGSTGLNYLDEYRLVMELQGRVRSSISLKS